MMEILEMILRLAAVILLAVAAVFVARRGFQLAASSVFVGVSLWRRCGKSWNRSRIRPFFLRNSYLKEAFIRDTDKRHCVFRKWLLYRNNMSAININENNFQNEVVDSDKPVLLDFWAPWCGPCRMVVPIVEEIAEERQNR